MVRYVYCETPDSWLTIDGVDAGEPVIGGIWEVPVGVPFEGRCCDVYTGVCSDPPTPIDPVDLPEPPLGLLVGIVVLGLLWSRIFCPANFRRPR